MTQKYMIIQTKEQVTAAKDLSQSCWRIQSDDYASPEQAQGILVGLNSNGVDKYILIPYFVL